MKRSFFIFALFCLPAFSQVTPIYVVFPPQSGVANAHFTQYVMPQPAIAGITQSIAWNNQEQTDATTNGACSPLNTDICQQDSLGFYHVYNWANADGILAQWFDGNSGWGTKKVNILIVPQTNGPNGATPYYLTKAAWTAAAGVQHYISKAKDSCSQDVGAPITGSTQRLTGGSDVATVTQNNAYHAGDTVWVYGFTDTTFNISIEAGTTIIAANATTWSYHSGATNAITAAGSGFSETQVQSWFVPTDNGYTVAIKALAAAAIAHWNASANLSQIGYIRGPWVRGGEQVMLCPDQIVANGVPGYANQAQAKTTWLAWDQDMTNYVATLNPKMQIMIPLNPGWTASAPDYTYGASQAAYAIAAVNANGQRDGFGSQGLQQTDRISTIPPPPYCAADWCEAANNYWTGGILSPGVQPIEGQQIDCSDPTAVWNSGGWVSGLLDVSCFQLNSGGHLKSKTGDFRVLLPYEKSKGLSLLELYNIDALLAFDPTYCNNPSNPNCGSGSVPAAVYAMRCVGPTTFLDATCPNGVGGDGTYAQAFNTFAGFGYQIGCTIPTCATGSFTIGNANPVGPPLYLGSITSTANTGVLSSYFSGLSVQNATAYDPTLGNVNCVTLATDLASEPNGKSMQGSWSGGANDLMWSQSFLVGGVKTWYMAADNVGGGIAIYEVQINSQRCAQIVNTGLPAWKTISGPFAWNYSGVGDVRTFYHMKQGHILESYTVTDITSMGSPTTMIDFLASGSCPGSGFPAAGGNWDSIMIPSITAAGNQRFSLSIGANGQGSAVWVFSYDTALGCYTANMNTGKWYPFCTSSCGSEPSQNFTTTGNYCYGAPGGATNNIHDGQASMDGTVFRMSETGGGPWTHGVCTGNTSGTQDPVLYIGTGNTDYTNGEANGNIKCPAGVNCQFDNHPSEGITHAIGGMDLGYFIRPVSSYSGPFTQIAPPLASFTLLGINDSHAAWVHPNNDDNFKMYLGETDSVSAIQAFGCANAPSCPSYLAQEIFGLPIDGSNALPKRFTHTHSCNASPSPGCTTVGNDGYFGPQFSIPSASPGGEMISWPCSDFGVFGTDSGGQLHSHMCIVVPN